MLLLYCFYSDQAVRRFAVSCQLDLHSTAENRSSGGAGLAVEPCAWSRLHIKGRETS